MPRADAAVSPDLVESCVLRASFLQVVVVGRCKLSTAVPRLMFGFSYIPLPPRSASASHTMAASVLAAVFAMSVQVVIEGMGRAVHTNLRTRFKCDALKLAMIKNQHLAETLFQARCCPSMAEHTEADTEQDLHCGNLKRWL